MTTKVIKAKNLSTHHEIVRGGDGARRTTHEICEIQFSGATVTATLAGSWERVPFERSDDVRVHIPVKS